jgi:HEAT repeat protein
MRRQIWMLCLLQPLLLGSAHAAIDEEPTLGGKPLGSWVNLLKTGQKAEERQHAAFAIMMFGDRAASAVPDLIAALDDPDGSVRDSAIGALTNLRGLASKAVPALADRLGDGRLNGGGIDPLHYPIFIALAAIGEPAVPELIRALDSKDEIARECAAKALRLIGPDARGATSMLAKHINDPIKNVAETCVEALHSIGPEAGGAIPALSALLRKTDIGLKDEAEMPNPRFQSLVDTLAALGADPDPALIRELESDRPRRFTALLLTAEYGPRAKSLAARVERLLADPDEDIRAQAADALCKIDPPGAIVINRSVAALSSPDPKLRLEAARFLSGIGPQAKGAMPALARALKDPDREVREQVALVISEIDPTVPAAVEILTEGFRRWSKDKDFSMTEIFSGALGSFGPMAREAIPVLSDYLKGRHLFNSDSTLVLQR